MYKVIKCIDSIVSFLSVAISLYIIEYIIEFWDIKQGSVVLLVEGCLIAGCLILQFPQLRTTNGLYWKAKIYLLCTGIVSVGLLLSSMIGICPSDQHAFISGGWGPRVASSRIFLRLPWERYVIVPYDPFGATFRSKELCLITGDKLENEITVSIEYQITFDIFILPPGFDQEGFILMFPERIKEGIVDGLDDLTLEQINGLDAHSRLEFGILNNLRGYYRGLGFDIESFTILNLKVEETKG